MADPNALDFLRIPSETLVALDWRPYHFAVQPYHYLIRAAHVTSMAGFFGGIATLDLRLMGWRQTLPLQPLAELVLPWLYVTFGITGSQRLGRMRRRIGNLAIPSRPSWPPSPECVSRMSRFVGGPAHRRSRVDDPQVC
jgi:hypothetical protein